MHKKQQPHPISMPPFCIKLNQLHYTRPGNDCSSLGQCDASSLPVPRDLVDPGVNF